MERHLAKETVKEQIDTIAPSMWSDDLTSLDKEDAVWLAWKKPVRFSIGDGFAVLDEMIDPIARIDVDYPISAAMRHRVRCWQTNILADIVQARVAREKAKLGDQEAIDHEFRKDWRNMVRDRVWVPQWR